MSITRNYFLEHSLSDQISALQQKASPWTRSERLPHKNKVGAFQSGVRQPGRIRLSAESRGTGA